MGGYPDSRRTPWSRGLGAAHTLLRSALAGVGLIVVAAGVLLLVYLAVTITAAMLGD